MSRTVDCCADFVVKNAKIHTVDLTIEQVRRGETMFTTIENGFVAVRDGRIAAVGAGSGADFIGSATQVGDARGKVLIPGIVDSHMHAQFAGEGLLNIDMRGTESADAMFALITERVKKTPEGKFIQGAYWNELVWKEPKIPTRAELDQLSAKHPMFFMRTCFHVAIVNSAALKLAGITKDTPDPDGGTIGRDSSGEPNGILYENAAMGLVQAVIPPLSEDEHIEAIKSIGAKLLESGITSIIDANLSFDQMRAYWYAYKKGALPYRARFMFYLDTATGSVDYHLKRLSEAVTPTGFGDDMLRLNAVKVTLDGIPGTGTACMRKPYKHMPETSGFTTITPEEINRIVDTAAKYHWQVGIHTIGDKAVDIALAAFEAAEKKYGNTKANRNYLIHVPFPHPEQLEKMRDLNISVTLQPTIMQQLGESAILHPEQAELNQPCKLFFKNGITLGGSSDHPVVSFNPFLGIYAGVTRIDDTTGKVLGPEHRITAREGLIMWTKNSAYFSHEDAVKGSIEVGNFADMALIDRDILGCPTEDIKGTKVLATILGGKIVYGHI
jgi:predicted amidohydrolase YtcJ